MIVASETHSYDVGKLVASTDKYQLYLCQQDGSGHHFLFQIALEPPHNGNLDRAAFILKKLKQNADELEAEYAKVRTDPNDLLNYDLGFPELADSFISSKQEGRRVNILAFRNVEDVGLMLPICNIVRKDRRRVDLRTSAWIMGKSLKLLAFAHNLGISVGCVDSTNILIEPEKHYVVFFDWSDAMIHSSENIPAEISSKEIAQAAQSVIFILGGDSEKKFVSDDGEKYLPYTDYLLHLAAGDQCHAEKAHAQFYKLIDEFWERAYYPFTSNPI